MSKLFRRGYLALVLLFLYLPIAVLIVQSFNAGVSRAKWEGFSLRWYTALFRDPSIMSALYVTLTVALLAALISTVLGTLAAIGIHAMRRRPQAMMMTLTNIPMTMPDIVTGISLMLLFIFTRVPRGYVTMLLAHVTFNIPYVILSVMPKLKQMNRYSYEAALDLGADARKTFLRVTLPLSLPGVVSGVTMVFMPSVTTFFIPRVLGGGNTEMFGDLIERTFLSADNWNVGSALSLIMMVLILLSLTTLRKFDPEGEGGTMI